MLPRAVSLPARLSSSRVLSSEQGPPLFWKPVVTAAPCSGGRVLAVFCPVCAGRQRPPLESGTAPGPGPLPAERGAGLDRIGGAAFQGPAAASARPCSLAGCQVWVGAGFPCFPLTQRLLSWLRREPGLPALSVSPLFSDAKGKGSWFVSASNRATSQVPSPLLGN